MISLQHSKLQKCLDVHSQCQECQNYGRIFSLLFSKGHSCVSEGGVFLLTSNVTFSNALALGGQSFELADLPGLRASSDTDLASPHRNTTISQKKRQTCTFHEALFCQGYKFGRAIYLLLRMSADEE